MGSGSTDDEPDGCLHHRERRGGRSLHSWRLVAALITRLTFVTEKAVASMTTLVTRLAFIPPETRCEPGDGQGCSK
jgi:hypothetical protein